MVEVGRKSFLNEEVPVFCIVSVFRNKSHVPGLCARNNSLEMEEKWMGREVDGKEEGTEGVEGGEMVGM